MRRSQGLLDAHLTRASVLTNGYLLDREMVRVLERTKVLVFDEWA